MIRLISAVPISILPPKVVLVLGYRARLYEHEPRTRKSNSVSALDALLHLIKLSAHATVINLAFQLNHQSPDQPRIALFLENHLFPGNPAERRTQPFQHRRLQGDGGSHSRLHSPLFLVQEKTITRSDRGQISQPISL